MRYITRLYEEDIRGIIAGVHEVSEDRVDIYVDADGKVVAEVETGEVRHDSK